MTYLLGVDEFIELVDGHPDHPTLQFIASNDNPDIIASAIAFGAAIEMVRCDEKLNDETRRLWTSKLDVVGEAFRDEDITALLSASTPNIAGLDLLPFTEREAAVWAELKSQKLVGDVDDLDLMIASTAITRGHTLLAKRRVWHASVQPITILGRVRLRIVNPH